MALPLFVSSVSWGQGTMFFVQWICFFLAGLLVIMGLGALLLRRWFPLPTRADALKALQPTQAKGVWPWGAAAFQRVKPSGLVLLEEPLDAYATRIAMIRAAQSRLDIQVYIWNQDLSGKMLMSEVVRAADRGVQVRLLIDDNTTTGNDAWLASVASHPSVALRLFNPLRVRRYRWVNYLFDFVRINRRMHNKSFTMDGSLTVVGGRNIGDEYFGATHQSLFIDLDVLASGPIAEEVTQLFDRYWESASAYDARGILAPASGEALEAVRQDPPQTCEHSKTYCKAIEASRFTQSIPSNALHWQWVPVCLLADAPTKGLDEHTKRGLLWSALKPRLQAVRHSLCLVSAYFVPAGAGRKLLVSLAKKGVQLDVVTNSWVASDVRLVHAGYMKSRPALLRSGVRLYEIMQGGWEMGHSRWHKHSARFSGSGQSLHAKVLVMDGKETFVGSFNFDARSKVMNTEMGFLIQSQALADNLLKVLSTSMPIQAWQVLQEKGELRWRKPNGSFEHSEPGTSRWDRFLLRFLSRFPIEELL